MEALIAQNGLHQEFQWLIRGIPAPLTFCKLEGYIRTKLGHAYELIETNFIVTDPLEAKFEVAITDIELERVFGVNVSPEFPQSGMLELWGNVQGLNRMLICKQPITWLPSDR